MISHENINHNCMQHRKFFKKEAIDSIDLSKHSNDIIETAR